jgi:DNA-binding response OmpR family regulator
VRFVIRGVPAEAVVLADPDRLMQVMSNLMSNAAKFSPSGGEVWIQAAIEGRNLRIAVRDFGSGIPIEFQGRIFEKFAQAEGVNTRRHDGTGLGLSITQKLVELMGGRIGFTTEAEKGTEFAFTVPLAYSLGESVSEPSESGARAAILVCEDDRDVSMLLKILLERAGFEVDVALSLAEARERLKAHAYAAMTLDLMLPDGNGVDFLREIRSDSRLVGLPIVVVSAKAEEGRRELNGDAIGMIDWMTKPIDEGLLVRALRNVSSGSGADKPRILHIEDDADLRSILARSLTDRVEWIGASSLQEAEDLLRRDRFDLVVLDLDLPDGSGLDLLERLNALTGAPLPVLILSATETSEKTRARVEAALVKSRMSEDRIVQTILSVIRKNPSFSAEIT